MACTGHTNSCPSHAGYEPAVTPSTWTDDPLSTSLNIKVIHHNELRTAIDAELTRWSSSWPTDPGAVTTDSTVDSDHIRNLRDGINAATAWTWPTYMADDDTGTDDTTEAQQYTAMRDQVNVIEAMCACDCNYACTCNCNYCTCNCNYCTCQCNYACTCNCNYNTYKSDIRLKHDIEYL